MSTTTQRLDALEAGMGRMEQMLAILVEGTAPAKTTVAAPKKEQPASLVAAKTHCYEARMTRRAKTALGGLTKAERSALYAAHPELSKMSATKRAAAWKAIVVAYKAEQA